MRSAALVIGAIGAIGAVTVAAGSARADSDVTTRGYLLSRYQAFVEDRSAELFPEIDLAPLQTFLEANVDLTLRGDRYTVRSDTSALYRISPYGCREAGDLPACLVINELYLSVDAIRDRMTVQIGRARPSWGSALSFHPVEPMNEQPDPTDPTFQRLGAWSAGFEIAGAHHIVTAAWFPKVSHFEFGAPQYVEPGLAGARYAWRPEGFDLSAIAFWDFEEQLPMAGASGSTVLGETGFEIHGEALVHQRRPLDAGKLREGTCPIRELAFPHRREWDYTALVGTRYERASGTLVNLEYLHNADGLNERDYDGVLVSKDLLLQQCPDLRIEQGDASESGRPQQLSSELLRRNYAILSILKPSFADEGKLANLGASASVFVGIDDTSGVVSGRLTYTYRDSIVMRAGTLVGYGADKTQYALAPFSVMLLFDIQALL